MAEVRRRNGLPARRGKRAGAGEGALLPPPSVPMAVARVFVAKRCTHEDILTLRHWRGGFWRWETSHWIRARRSRREKPALRVHRKCLLHRRQGAGALGSQPPQDRRSARGPGRDLHPARRPGSTLLARTMPATGVIVAVDNGLLDVEHRQLHPAHAAISSTRRPSRSTTTRKRRSQNAGATFSKRCGRTNRKPSTCSANGSATSSPAGSTCTRSCSRSAPRAAAKVPSLASSPPSSASRTSPGPRSIAWAAISAWHRSSASPLAIISDARFVGKNSNIVVERLLSISGEDTLTVNRKYRNQWTGKLPSRLHVISNELPRLGDASTAVVGRIVLLLLSRSWLGKEDHELEHRLRLELPGILNWALAGLERLTVNNDNRFTRLPSAEEAIIAMRDLASPVAAFVREKCEIGVSHEVKVDLIYGSYKTWCEDNEHPKASKQIFGRDLRAAVPSVRKTRPRNDEHSRHHVYSGIRLIPASGHSGHGDQAM